MKVYDEFEFRRGLNVGNVSERRIGRLIGRAGNRPLERFGSDTGG
jgi:hypothetical protein